MKKAGGITRRWVRNIFSVILVILIVVSVSTCINDKIRNPNVDAERINVPANPRHYWRYRMHLTLEELLNYAPLNDRIKNMIIKSGRLER